MEKKIIITLLLLNSLCFTCSDVSEFNSEEAVRFYNDRIKTFSFSSFECYNFLQLNQSRKNTDAEFHVEFFKECGQPNNKELKPLRAIIRYEAENGNPLVISTEIPSKYLPKSLLRNFYSLGASNLFYSSVSKLGFTVYPNLRFIRDCGNVDDTHFILIEDCWYYKLNRTGTENHPLQ